MALIASSGLKRVELKYAPHAWNLLNGVFCVYKPSGVSMQNMKDAIILNLCKDLNAMEGRKSKNIVKIEGSVEKGDLVVTNVPSLADTTQVLGPRYQIEDFRISWANYMKKFSSGVCVLGVNKGCWQTLKLRKGRHLRTFEVSGRFGYSTHNLEEDGNIIEKTTYDHIRLPLIEKLLASWQAAHQKLMFEFSGVDPQSQEAYELAVKGALRPADDSVPIIYGIRCTKFKLPDFSLEFDCINEDQDYLMNLVHELGLRMKSAAVCTKVRCVHYAFFSVDLALLRKHWRLEDILTNITHCKQLLSKHSIIPESAEDAIIHKT